MEVFTIMSLCGDRGHQIIISSSKAKNVPKRTNLKHGGCSWKVLEVFLNYPAHSHGVNLRCRINVKLQNPVLLSILPIMLSLDRKGTRSWVGFFGISLSWITSEEVFTKCGDIWPYKMYSDLNFSNKQFPRADTATFSWGLVYLIFIRF